MISCTADDEAAGTVTLDPSSGSAAGYYRVSADLHDIALEPSEVTAVTLGGVSAFDLLVEASADGDSVLSFMVQGAPSGPVDLVLQADRAYRFSEAFEYDLPVAPGFEGFFALGASLTQGVQGGVPTYHGILHGPAAVVAQQVGAYFPLPLLKEGLFPALGPEDVGPAPDCVIPDVVGFVSSAAVDVLVTFQDPETGLFDFGQGRVDPDIEPHNLAVGGARVDHVVNGTPASDFGGQFLAHLVLGPNLALEEPVQDSQLDRLEAADPTVVIATDLFGNDIIGAVVNSTGIVIEEMTPESEFAESLEILVARLAATEAEVFLANLPQPTLLPMAAEYATMEVARARAAAEAAGEDPDAAAEAMAADVGARLEVVDEVAVRFNQILEETAAPYETIHVVDLAEQIDDLVRDGVEIGGETFKVQKLGGLLSVDGIHFSDTGYALAGDFFIQEINRTLGTSVPRIDLDEVVQDDPFAPGTMLAGGLDPGCLP